MLDAGLFPDLSLIFSRRDEQVADTMLLCKAEAGGMHMRQSSKYFVEDFSSS